MGVCSPMAIGLSAADRLCVRVCARAAVVASVGAGCHEAARYAPASAIPLRARRRPGRRIGDVVRARGTARANVSHAAAFTARVSRPRSRSVFGLFVAAESLSRPRPSACSEFRILVARLEALPGVSGVGLASNVPFSGDHWRQPRCAARMIPEARTPAAVPRADVRAVSANLFELLQMPLAQGRAFTLADGPPHLPLSPIVNQSLARRLAPAGDVLGRTVRIGSAAAAPAVPDCRRGDRRAIDRDERRRPERGLRSLRATDAMHDLPDCPLAARQRCADRFDPEGNPFRDARAGAQGRSAGDRDGRSRPAIPGAAAIQRDADERVFGDSLDARGDWPLRVGGVLGFAAASGIGGYVPRWERVHVIW